MSLRDDLEQLFTYTGRDTRYTEEWQKPYLRLRAALTPAAEKWLEALPELLKLQANLKNAVHTEYLEEFNLQVALRTALHEAATLHNAPEHGDKDAYP